jgi:hypothetical protein
MPAVAGMVDGTREHARRIFHRVMSRTSLYPYWMLSRVGPLRDDGWFRSFRAGTPLDLAGDPLPWLPYPVIDLLDGRARGDMAVFEYGCGSSTLWWAERVREVISFEMDAGWYETIKKRAPRNVTLQLATDERSFVRAASAFSGRFNIVVIDGPKRSDCAPHALSGLRRDGVVLWDDSQRPEYEEGFEVFLSRGFRRLPIAGLQPGHAWKAETSIFYRDGNCLGI